MIGCYIVQHSNVSSISIHFIAKCGNAIAIIINSGFMVIHNITQQVKTNGYTLDILFILCDLSAIVANFFRYCK